MTTLTETKPSPFDYIDKTWDFLFPQDQYRIDEGGWFSAYNPAAVDAVTRRYQFWECEHRNPDADINALAGRPWVEDSFEFRRLAERYQRFVQANDIRGQQSADLGVRRTVIWNQLIAMKWEERKRMMEYIPAHTNMRDPLLPYPELKDRPRQIETPHGRMEVHVLPQIFDDRAYSMITEIAPSGPYGGHRFHRLEQSPGMSWEGRFRDACAVAENLAQMWSEQEP